MSTYKFEATIKSVVNNGEIEFRIVPTGHYAIKSPNGDTHYVAFSEADKKVRELLDDELKYKMECVDVALVPWLSAHADSGHSVEFMFEESAKILKVKEIL